MSMISQPKTICDWEGEPTVSWNEDTVTVLNR